MTWPDDPQNITALQNKPKTPGSKPARYDPNAAYDFAQKYYTLTCPDGVMALDSKPTTGVTPGVAIENWGTHEEKVPAQYADDKVAIVYKDMEDCTHFTSCCLGNPFNKTAIVAQKYTLTWDAQNRKNAPRLTAGGLDIHAQPGVNNVNLY